MPDSLKAALAGQFDEEIGILPVSITPGGDTIVQWVETRNGQRVVLVGRLHEGILDSAITTESPGVVTIGGWIGNAVAVGNYTVPVDPSISSNSVLMARPVLLDFDSATVTPLNIGDSTFADPIHIDRDSIVSVQSGAFAMVDTGGDCLNVRETASVNSKSLGCFADGVLLRATDQGAVNDEGRWQVVTTPSGQNGSANLAFLAH